ncbi:conserved hypothetical protein [Rhizobium rhizogenes K84]|uniref:Uncharacterized protein n=1 Tax=Rhizobium rhizogenes (strain K84 / ATCC BAA-868) TaxID=311403 RepID=B9JAU7_RHIR8|nr:conserved hypothetical protein [Rhizobium rhizogenes K84]
MSSRLFNDARAIGIIQIHREANTKFSGQLSSSLSQVYGPASRCLVASGGGMTQFLLDAQLYPDLGFGEMTQSMQSIYGRNYYLNIKIEKAGAGSKMTVSAGNTLVNTSRTISAFSWAEGKTSC